MVNSFKLKIATTLWITLAGMLTAQQADRNTSEMDPATIFSERIMPIFRSPEPSSCVQCHLSSVDLKNYILPSHEKTFVSLRDQGLIDMQRPRESKIIKLIKMGHQDQDKGARLIHAEMRKAEYEAFAAWIEACCKDADLLALPALKESEYAKPAVDDKVIRHARKSRVVDSFERSVWSQRMRCFPCHTPAEIGPHQKGPLEKYKEWESEYGELMSFFKETPEKTLDYMIEQSKNVQPDELPLINLKEPSKSLLLLKPTSKVPELIDGKRVPAYTEPVSHMGGLKMHADDQSYKLFIAWIKDYANVVNGTYAVVDELPADNWHATQHVLRLKETPQSWPVGTPVQLFVHARSKDNHAFDDQPIAFTQGTVTPKRIVNGALILLANDDERKALDGKEDESRLAAGSYLIKICVDRDGKLAEDPAALLGKEDYIGRIQIKNALWKVGFQNAEVISATHILRKDIEAK